MKPVLSKKISPTDFQKFYWYKKDLIDFCRKNKIPAHGGKIELAEKIAYYLSTGKIKEVERPARSDRWDSSNTITSKTPVINYRNDAKTRDFFVSQIGKKFRFNHYLRAFAKQKNDGTKTYSDLVLGWHESLINKKTTIDKQFEYNQFQRDFHQNEPRKTAKECNAAWKFIKSMAGKPTYKNYLKLKKK